ncbi:MAG: hypothetical protein KJO34_11500 [Deltaproteobacteria bacterium]|nr:hypothetical protein [Deltaproteobacteria bacterium]
MTKSLTFNRDEMSAGQLRGVNGGEFALKARLGFLFDFEECGRNEVCLSGRSRGLSDGSLDWEIVNGILAQISEPGEDGNHHLRGPADVSDNEIRQVLAAVKDAVDESGISKEKIEIDISDEFKKSVEETLGRSLF